MSRCTTGTCPHKRGVFIWLGDGPWRDDPADPDYGRYPWVHATTMIPGHLTVCELMPFATALEAGEAPVTTLVSAAAPANPPAAPVREPVPFRQGPAVQLSLFGDAADGSGATAADPAGNAWHAGQPQAERSAGYPGPRPPRTPQNRAAHPRAAGPTAPRRTP